MSDTPWLTIVGLGEDGPDGLPTASREAILKAEIVMGPARHLDLLGETSAQTIPWPVPFSDGIDMLLGLRGQRVVVLASGDPFWFGAGTTLTRRLNAEEWQAYPGRSAFALAASQMGWPLEQTACHGLHAAPFEKLKPDLAPGTRAIVLLRDGSAVADLAQWLCGQGFGETDMTVLEALGGPRQRVRTVKVDRYDLNDVIHPVCAALSFAGPGRVLPVSPGRSEDWFEHDGQITKSPVRALTLAALSPRPHDHLWDIGGGSGSVSVEWLLSHPSLRATVVEPRPDRVERIERNGARFGVGHRMTVVEDEAPEGLAALSQPQAVFIGGGLSQNMLEFLWGHLETGTRIVANAVTLESEALLTKWHGDVGGDLMRIELARAEPLGRKSGWKSAYPVVQWSATR